MEKKAFFEEVAERLIEQLKQGTSPLQRVWQPGMGALPYNPTTGKRYKGGNSLWLSMQGRGDPRWLTYNQAQALGAQVRKGEKSTTIEYWKFREEQVKKGEDGKPLLDANGNKITWTVELERPKVFYAKVFNAEQIDGLPPLERKEQTWDAIERAEHILAASGARITHQAGDRAFYRPSTDGITLPERGQFPTSANYYAVAMHELGHWTGHPSRLDRDLSHPFGSEGYAREELRAEIASMMLGTELGLGRDPGQHAAYVSSWIKVLEDDPREIFRASSDAEKIQNFILAFEQVQEIAHSQQADQAGVVQPWAQEHAEVWQHLLVESEEALPGYRSAESYLTLKRAAEEHGFEAVLRWSHYANDKSPFIAKEGMADIYIQYLDGNGKELPIHTEMGSGDGKAVTCLDGRRLYGTGFTSDNEWQEQAFASAVATMQHRAMQQEANAMEHAHQAPEQAETIDYKAERWIIGRLDTQLVNDLDRMDEKQLATVDRVLEDMVPLNNENPFWLRHRQAAEAVFADIDRFEEKLYDARKAVLEKIDQSARSVPAADTDAALIEALKVQRNYILEGEHDAAAVHRAESVQPVFLAVLKVENPMPANWTGGVRVAQEGDGHVVQCELADGSYLPLATRSSEDEAFQLADKLREIDARAQLDPNESAVKLAELHEDQVKRNPSSTVAEVAAAREAKKGAEITATLNSLGVKESGLPRPGVELANVADQNTWLAVPYEERDAAKRAAGRLPNGKPAIDFDSSTKCWYARAGADLDKVRQWLPENRPIQERAKSPREELADTMRQMGLVVEGKHPILDGEWHRVPVQGGGKDNTSGAYRVYDLKPGEKGVPAGTIQNHRTGEKTNWKAKGYLLTDSERAQMHAESAVSQATRTQEREAAQFRAETAIAQLLAVAPSAPADATYLVAKQARPDGLKMVPTDTSALPADSIILIGKTAQESKLLRKEHPDKLVFTAGDLLLTAQDMADKVKTVQSIRPNGTKMFAKGTEKHSHFHVVGGGGIESLEAVPVIVVSEGYATADTISQTLGYPTVASFDSGNLPHVGRQLRERFPEKPLLFAGDNDLHQVLTDRKNPGRLKAEEAAAATGGVAIFPVFAPGEQEYPANVEAIDSEKAKASQLTDAQKDALTAMKRFTDFNDLATKSKFGRDGVDRQLRTGVALAVKENQARVSRQAQEQELKRERVESKKLEEPVKRRAVKR